MLVFVAGLIRVVRRAVVYRMRLARETSLRLAEGGPLELHLEGPGLGRMPALRFALEDRATERAVELTPIRLRSRVRGARHARRSVHSLAIDRAGDYVLRVGGIGSLYDPAAYSVVFMRPVRGRMFLSILGIVVGAWFFTFGVLSLALGV